MFNNLKIKKEGGLKSAKTKSTKTGLRLFISALLSLLLFVAMAVFYNKLTEKDPTVNILMSAKHIPEGTVITEHNVTEYFKFQAYPENLLPEGYYIKDTFTELLNHQVIMVGGIGNNMAITSNMTEPVNSFLRTMNEPILITFRVDSAYQALSGSVRAGDVVSAQTVDGKYHIPQLYVTDVYDASFVNIPNSDTQSLATVFAVYINKDDRDAFLKISEGNSLYVTKEKSLTEYKYQGILGMDSRPETNENNDKEGSEW